ncbi:hypothetical protein MP228_009500 [Amoeboaphelidium protococcarum]|nr:hypothetical protein MP228_009500 [Amoeboaphelidium protococcarum]
MLEKPQEVKEAVKIMTEAGEYVSLESPTDSHLPYTRDELYQIGLDGAYELLKDISAKQEELLKHVRDQNRINANQRQIDAEKDKELNDIKTRLDSLENHSYKIVLMTVLEVYYKKKMFTKTAPPYDFSLSTELDRLDPGQLLSNTGLSVSQWRQMRQLCLRNPSGRNAVVHEKYPSFEIAEKAFQSLVGVDKPVLLLLRNDKHIYEPDGRLEMNDKLNEEDGTCVNVMTEANDISKLESSVDSHRSYTDDASKKTNQFGFYEILKSFNKDLEDINYSIKDQQRINDEQNRINEQHFKQLSELKGRLGVLENFSYKSVLMTMIAVFFKEKMYAYSAPPDIFSLSTAIDIADPGQLQSKTGFSVSQWRAMLHACVDNCHDRDIVVNEKYPSFEIAEKAFLLLVGMDKPDTELRRLFMRILEHV